MINVIIKKGEKVVTKCLMVEGLNPFNEARFPVPKKATSIKVTRITALCHSLLSTTPVEITLLLRIVSCDRIFD